MAPNKMEKRMAWEKTLALRPVLHAYAMYRERSRHQPSRCAIRHAGPRRENPIAKLGGEKKKGQQQQRKVFCGMKISGEKNKNKIKILWRNRGTTHSTHQGVYEHKRRRRRIWGYNLMCRKKKGEREKKKTNVISYQ